MTLGFRFVTTDTEGIENEDDASVQMGIRLLRKGTVYY